jgi:hypothetical protein
MQVISGTLNGTYSLVYIGSCTWNTTVAITCKSYFDPLCTVDDDVQTSFVISLIKVNPDRWDFSVTSADALFDLFGFSMNSVIYADCESGLPTAISNSLTYFVCGTLGVANQLGMGGTATISWP